MSNLNNVENINKKNHNTKNIVIGLIIFAFIAVATTAGAIYIKLSNTEQIKKEEEISNEVQVEEVGKEEVNTNVNKKRKDVKGVQSLTETYCKNDLEVKDLFISDIIADPNTYVIKGLKNKTIENNINDEVKEVAKKIYNKLKDENISITVQSNFSDVISVYVHGSNDEDGFMFEGLNYRLDTGEKLAFEDIFTNEANIKAILAKGLYRRLAFIHYEKQQSYGGDISKEDYGYFEDKIFDLISTYNKKGITNFVFRPEEVWIELDETIYDIKLDEFYKDIAIYNRFKSDSSLYENSNIGYKNIFVFSSRGEGITKNDYWEEFSTFREEDNSFIDIRVYKDFPNLSVGLAERIQTDIKNRIDEMKKENDKDKGYCYQVYVEVRFDDNNEPYISGHFEQYEMLKSYYDSNLKIILIDEYNQEGGGVDRTIDINDENKNDIKRTILKLDFLKEDIKEISKVENNNVY